jgi:hypothetical protein
VTQSCATPGRPTDGDGREQFHAAADIVLAARGACLAAATRPKPKLRDVEGDGIPIKICSRRQPLDSRRSLALVCCGFGMVTAWISTSVRSARACAGPSCGCSPTTAPFPARPCTIGDAGNVNTGVVVGEAGRPEHGVVFGGGAVGEGQCPPGGSCHTGTELDCVRAGELSWPGPDDLIPVGQASTEAGLCGDSIRVQCCCPRPHVAAQ